MGKMLTPKTDFEFDCIEKGDYVLKVKETKVEPQKDGKTSGKSFIAVLTPVGGSEEGKVHFERFFENSKDDFSMEKLAGFVIKLGMLKPTGPIDIDLFRTPEFEERWLKNAPGREMGGKIAHRTTGQGGVKLDNPQSDLKVYYTKDEVLAVLAKKQVTGAPGISTAAPAAATTAAPAAPTTSAWD